jgi:FAD/FMN-containing dehydrogenase/Fe-S oxidoreductase
MDDGELAARLQAVGVTEVDVSARRRAEYSGDASLYRVVPAAVVFPRSTDDVEATLSVCRSLGVSLTARGAGTSIAGNAVGAGVVLDFSRHLNRIEHLDPDARTASVQPGVVLDHLQRAALPHGLRFGPDPSTHSRCTIGGMLGNNACGSRALAYGRSADNVRELDLVTGTGERLAARPGMASAASPTVAALHAVVQRNLGVIRTELGRFRRQVSGYSLEHLLPEHGNHLPAALVGTEGTCGVLLRATVDLVAPPEHTVLLVLGYPDMASAADAAPALVPFGPITLEGMDGRMVDVVRQQRGAAAVPDLPAGGGWLFAELDAAGAATADVIGAAGALASKVVTDPAEAAALWLIREDGAGLAARSVGGHAGWEDAAVPPDRLGAYLREFEALLADRGLIGTPYGHFGDGCVHIRISFPLDRPGGVAVFREFVTDAAKLVAGYGGSLSGEHGDGRARGALLPLMYSPEALNAFAEVKAVFDPDNVLNPGVLVAPRPMDADLRIPAAPPVRRNLALHYAEDGGDFSAAVHRCTGVAKCRADNTASGGVMCPSYLATGDEKDSTRGRARVLQEMVNGGLVRDGWRSPEVREALDLCLSCKGCASDCPTGVDMATYKAEALYQAYRHRPRPAAHYALGWLPYWARLAARMPRLANRLLAAPGPARLGKRLAGVDQRRALPTLADRTFRSWFADHPRATGDPVLLWVDTFTDLFTPDVGIAAVRVLEDAGFAVRIPDRPLCCGLTWVSTGQLDTARRVLRRSVDALAEPARKGIPIVALEPSCNAVFRGDAGHLLGDRPGVAEVAGAVRTLAELLADRPQWTPPSLAGIHALAQPHCHQHAVLGWSTDRTLLENAGADVKTVGGCCGLAGNFGAERGHYDVSVAVAETALLPAVRAAQPGTRLLADGFSCRTQLAELAGRQGEHIAQLLASRLDAD